MSAYNACRLLACTHELTPPPFATTPRLPRRYDVSNPEELSTQFAEAMVKVQKGFKSIRWGAPPLCHLLRGHHSPVELSGAHLILPPPYSSSHHHSARTLTPCVCCSMIFMGLGYGIGSTIVAFIPSIGQWEVSLVVMSTVPLLIGAASLMMYIAQPHTVLPYTHPYISHSPMPHAALYLTQHTVHHAAP